MRTAADVIEKAALAVVDVPQFRQRHLDQLPLQKLHQPRILISSDAPRLVEQLQHGLAETD